MAAVAAEAATLGSSIRPRLKRNRLEPIFHLRKPTSKAPILMPSSSSGCRTGTSPEMSPAMATSAASGGFEFDTQCLLGDGDSGKGKMGRRLFLLGESAPLSISCKWIVALLFGIVIVWKHDGEILWIALGSVINTWLSVVLKKVLNHQRPAPHLKSDPGMPSSHAQSIFYGAIILILSLVTWRGISIVTVGAGSIILASSSYLCWLRISQQFHTVNQVLVGAALGSTSAMFWFWLWQAFVLEAFVASIAVRVVVVVSAVLSCLVFLLHVIRHWLEEK